MQMITKDEATAAQRTIVFFAADVTDGFTPEPTIDFSDAGDVQLSKAGGAFANATGVVTELAVGFYKLVLSAADVDTLGDLTLKITNAGVRTVIRHFQVTALDLNVATVNPGADGITAATLAADAGTELRTGLATAAGVASIALATRTVVKDLGVLEADGQTNTAGGNTAISMLDAIDATVTLSGTWDSATVTLYTSEDPGATSPTWTPVVSGAFTSDDVITVAGPHSAIKAVMSNDGAASAVAISVAIRKAANT